MAGEKLARAFPDRVGRRNVAQHEISLYLLQINHSRARAARHGVQRKKIGREAYTVRGALPHQRLNSVSISREDHFFSIGVDPAKRKHTPKALERVDTPLSERCKQDLSVASRPETRAVCFQFATKFLEIVDLAIEDDPGAAFILHRLTGTLRQIDDFEPRVAKHPILP